MRLWAIAVALCAESYDQEHQQQGCDELADEVERIVADGRSCTEYAQLRVFIGCGIEVILVEQPYDDTANHATDHLTGHIGRNRRPRELTGNSETDRHGRVEMSSRVRAGDQYAHAHCKTPTNGDYDPACSLSFTLVQTYGTANAVSENYQYHRTDQLHKELCCH